MQAQFDKLSGGLQASHPHALPETPDQQAFDDVALIIARTFQAPMAAVTLVDDDGFRLKSQVGVELSAPIPAENSFSRHASERSDPLVVPDASKDERFAGHPMVAGEPHLRFYAGTALETSDGFPIGVVWIADREPRDLAGPDLEVLKALGRQVVTIMELARSNARRADELARLEQVARERTLLLRELQHRVRNNLQVIESLITLQIGSERVCGARDALERIQVRLRPLLLVDRHLDADRQQAEVDLATFLEMLCRHLVELHGSQGDVELVLSLDPAPMTRERAVSIGLIVNEFVTNSFKHAFSDRGGTLSVTLVCYGGRLSLALADDGPGLPDGSEEGGLGLRIIPALVEQLGGSLVWHRGAGTKLTVKL